MKIWLCKGELNLQLKSELCGLMNIQVNFCEFIGKVAFGHPCKSVEVNHLL